MCVCVQNKSYTRVVVGSVDIKVFNSIWLLFTFTYSYYLSGVRSFRQSGRESSHSRHYCLAPAATLRSSLHSTFIQRFQKIENFAQLSRIVCF